MDRPRATREAGAGPPAAVGGADRLALVVVALLVAAFFWRVLLLGEVLLPLDILGRIEPWHSESELARDAANWNTLTGDAVTQQYPEAVASARAWGHGPPLWDPTVLTGMPALATGRAWTSPIIVALGRLLPADRALSLATVLHLLIGAVSCLLLLGELGCGRVGAIVGSAVFTFNPYFVGWLSHHSLVGGWVWVPLVFFGFEAALRRGDWRWSLLGGVGFALQVLGGYVLWPYYTGLLLVVYAVVRTLLRLRAGGRLRAVAGPLLAGAGIGVVGLGLSAPMWLLTAELFGRTERVADLFAGVEVPVSQMARLAVPHLWGLPLHGGAYLGFFNYVETGLSVGVVPLVMAAAAFAARGRRRPLLVLGIGVVAYLAVFGIEPARALVELVNPTLYRTFPGRVFYVTAFGLALAAGIGTDWLDRTRPARLLRLLSGLAVAAAVTLVLGAAVVSAGGFEAARIYTRLPASLLDPLTAPGRGVLVATAVLLAAAVALRGWLLAPAARWPGPALVAIVVVELFFHGIGFNPSFPPAMTFPTTPTLEVLENLVEISDQPVRVVNVPSGDLLPGQMPMVWGLQTPTGYSSWLLRRYAAYTALIPEQGGGPIEVYFSDCASPLLHALGPRYVCAPADYPLLGAGALRLDQRLARARVRSHFPGGSGALTWPVDGTERPVLLASGPTEVTYELTLPHGARLATEVGLDPEAWPLSDGMSFEVLFRGPGEPASVTLVRIDLDPRSRVEDRRFVPVELDLPGADGGAVELVLATGSGPSGDPTCDWGGWVEPRLLVDGEPTLELIHDGGNRVYRNRRALPRAWLVHRVRRVPPGDLSAAAAALTADGFDPASEAVVEGDIAAELGAADTADDVRVVSFTAERVELAVRSADPALVVVSDMFYPGWRASVDGAEAPILATNLVMRGVVVPAGSHRLVLEYRPARFTAGLVVAALVATGVVAALVVWSARRRRLGERTRRGAATR